MSLDLSIQVKIFDHPFVYILLNHQVEQYCAYCLQEPRSKGKKLLVCGGCHWYRYCDKICQRASWKDHHKPECHRLQTVFPHLPVTEVIFLGRICDKLRFIAENGDVYLWEKERPFSDLMDHAQEIRETEEKMQHFELIYMKAQKYMGDKMPDKEEFFTICCKSWINSHSVHTNLGTEVGMALDLGISKYDHSCRPNVTMVFDGFKAILRPLIHGIDAGDPRKARIAYIDVGRSKYQRRKELQEKWYFWCNCERCLSPDDDRLTAIRCANRACSEPIIITETMVPPKKLRCPTCDTKIPEELIIEAQSFMKALPSTFQPSDEADSKERLRIYLEKAEKLLHKENIYFCRLLTSYLQMNGGLEQEMTNLELQKSVYNNYKKCLPAADRHIGFQLLHIVRSLIVRNKREEAVRYAYEAMRIFEICFGLDHPYYLQTLALWTFLDTKAKKSNEELLKLMEFNYSRPINLTALLRRAERMSICL
ncbi:hypothetical protein M514_08030 [Trichuris suis]|uniref:MYND-type domain-containing protein n=1 Tax=Trichuris suis TaxID=68888 RepID=A0A085MUT8_9BILA|nr:hypothetical protein M513_08030 [Trichuris suis]KFD60984.1 hypothetical protein M514_08030 [Trichuris suis]